MDHNTTPDGHDDVTPDEMFADPAILDEENADIEDGLDDADIEDAITAVSESDAGPADQLRDLVAWLVNQLVDEPGKVTVDAVQRGSSVQVQVRLPEADLGKVIGRGGRIAKSMRTALMIVGSRHHLRVSLDIEGQA